jgi:hypothetical protein
MNILMVEVYWGMGSPEWLGGEGMCVCKVVVDFLGIKEVLFGC